MSKEIDPRDCQHGWADTDDGSPSIEKVVKLDGKQFAMLNEQEQVILNFYRDRGRKYGVSVSILSEVDPQKLAQAKSRQQADQILKSANSKVSVKVL